jgi:hypothetical protein
MPASDGNSETQVPVVLAVPRAGLQADEGSLLARINGIQTVLGRPLIEKAFIVDRREIPVGVTGKVLKRELRRRFVTGDFDTDRSCMVREASG